MKNNSFLDPQKKYDLFCLLEKQKTEELIETLKKEIDESLEYKKEEFIPAYKIKEISGEHQYITFFFSTSSEKLEKLKIILKKKTNRYILLNLFKERKTAKIVKLPNKKKENPEQIKLVEK